MEYAGDPEYKQVDGYWLVEGPNSGGVTFCVLWRGHLFTVQNDFSSGSISAGIPAAEFAARHRGTTDPRYQHILADLAARGLSGG